MNTRFSYTPCKQLNKNLSFLLPPRLCRRNQTLLKGQLREGRSTEAVHVSVISMSLAFNLQLVLLPIAQVNSK